MFTHNASMNIAWVNIQTLANNTLKASRIKYGARADNAVGGIFGKFEGDVGKNIYGV